MKRLLEEDSHLLVFMAMFAGAMITIIFKMDLWWSAWCLANMIAAVWKERAR